MGRAKKKRRVGPYKKEEIESVEKIPKKKKKKKLFADEPWLEQERKKFQSYKDTYYQDPIDKKYDKKAESERKKKTKEETYFQDQFDEDDD